MAALEARVEEDTILERFMIQSNYKIPEAEKCWEKYITWRQENKIDEILLQRPRMCHEKVRQYWDHGYHRRAANGGHIVWYDCPSSDGFTHLTNIYDSQDIEQYYVFRTEYMYKYLEPLDPGGKAVNVYDLSKMTFASLFSSKHLTYSKRIMQLCNAFYPERADKIFFVNVPRFFAMIFKIASSFMDVKTQKKVVVCSPDYHEFIEYVGASSVPSRYGGTDTLELGESPEEASFIQWLLSLPPQSNAAEVATNNQTLDVNI